MGRSAEESGRIVHGTLFGEAVNASVVATLLASDDGQYVAANDEACRLTGYSRSELIKFRTGQLAGDNTSRHIYEAITQRRELEGVKTVRRRDGRLVRCQYLAVPTRVALTPHYLLMLRPESRASAA